MPIPKYLLDSEYLESNFLIPFNEKLRSEEEKKLAEILQIPELQLPEHAKLYGFLSARYTALVAYNSKILENGK